MEVVEVVGVKVVALAGHGCSRGAAPHAVVKGLGMKADESPDSAGARSLFSTCEDHQEHPDRSSCGHVSSRRTPVCREMVCGDSWSGSQPLCSVWLSDTVPERAEHESAAE